MNLFGNFRFTSSNSKQQKTNKKKPNDFFFFPNKRDLNFSPVICFQYESLCFLNQSFFHLFVLVGFNIFFEKKISNEKWKHFSGL